MYFLLLTTVWHSASWKVTSFLIALPPGVALSALQHDVRHSPSRCISLFWHLDLMMNLIRDMTITHAHREWKEIFRRNQEISNEMSSHSPYLYMSVYMYICMYFFLITLASEHHPLSSWSPKSWCRLTSESPSCYPLGGHQSSRVEWHYKINWILRRGKCWR